jgi:hypothetical protein
VKPNDNDDLLKLDNFVQSIASALDGTSMLYETLLDKVPDIKLSHLFRWAKANNKRESVHSFNEWLNLEAEIEQRMREL